MTARKSLTLRREPKAVRAARAALASLDADFPSHRLFEASLCLSELVANAIQHTGTRGQLELTLALEADRLRVEVSDPGRGFDPGPSHKGDEGGWGLLIVDRLADAWGIEGGERTVVWFEMGPGNGRLSTRWARVAE